MARIAGVDLPRDKRIEVALTYIYGIGKSSAQQILAKTDINPDTKVRDLTEEEASRLREEIGGNYKVEGDLRREVALNIKRLIEVGTYPWFTSSPRTAGARPADARTNARCRKGPKKTVGHSQTIG